MGKGDWKGWFAKKEEIIIVMSHLFDCGLNKSHKCTQMSTHICSGPADLSFGYHYIILIREGKESPEARLLREMSPTWLIVLALIRGSFYRGNVK